MKQEIQIKCKGATALPLSSLVDFQGNLKSLSDENYGKLKQQIVELGFSEPVSVWKSGKKNFILNGHQRVKTLTKMVEEGFSVPDIPVNMVEAESISEAKRILLSLASQYGKVEAQGLYDFMQGADISLDDFSQNFAMPEIDVKDFTANYFDASSKDDGTGPDSEPPPPLDEFVIAINCRDEAEQMELYEELQSRNIQCKIM
jgi:hypothetical protein